MVTLKREDFIIAGITGLIFVVATLVITYASRKIQVKRIA